jgi:hypothetical protein
MSKSFIAYLTVCAVAVVGGVIAIIFLLNPKPSSSTLAQAPSQASTEASPTPYHGNYFGPSEMPDTREVIDLSSGNYIAGEDFVAGKYDITAISGSGNVISDNMLDGGINAILSSDPSQYGDFADYYKREFKNIDLPEGTALKIDGLTIRLSPS